jgi:hypothetical protein
VRLTISSLASVATTENEVSCLYNRQRKRNGGGLRFLLPNDGRQWMAAPRRNHRYGQPCHPHRRRLGRIRAFFWETIFEGRPLHILVIYLPTRSPELNPIELVFHIFAQRVISYRLRHDSPGGGVDRAIIRFGTQVLNGISYETILKCCQHCGYCL